jgi:site-specific recombinase XerD
VPVLSDDKLARLLAACKGAAFENIRDQAVIRLFIDTGIRASELVGLTLEDVDLGAQLAYVEGKGGRAGQYRSAYVPQTRCASTSRSDAGTFSLIRRRRFWLGRKGQLTYYGVAQMLERRAADAGIDHLHLHRFRHTMAHRWLSAGRQEQDLMRLAG